jgi:predicted RecB family nuclease
MDTRRRCQKGHQYWKSSDCPTCPICEAARTPAAEFMQGLSAPARRALEGVGLTTLAKLAKRTEREVLGLHGMGPASMPKLRAALRKAGKKFAEH